MSARRALQCGLLTPVVAALAACGGGTDAHGPADTSAAAAPVQQLTSPRLAVQLGNGFRQGLYRLAVMSQPGDESSDLGQPLPTGTLRSVRCEPVAGTSTWTCTVRWATVDGHRTVTRYRIDVDRRGCFYGAATPPLPQHYDSTIRTYSENPLNAVQSLRRGC